MLYLRSIHNSTLALKHFGENQLSPGSIGISPLPTAHPQPFQQTLVRSSTRSYPRFNLAMDRSPGFGSTACNYNALFRLAFATAPCFHNLTLLHTITRRLILQKARRHTVTNSAPTACRHTVSGSISLPSRGSFHLSLTVLVHYRSQEVFSLRRWSSRIPTGFHVSRATRDTYSESSCFSPTGLSPSMADLSRSLRLTTSF